MRHWKLGSFCPCCMTHEFKPAEFHSTCCGSKSLFPQQNFFAITGMSHDGTVPATCPCYMPPSVCWPLLREIFYLNHVNFRGYSSNESRPTGTKGHLSVTKSLPFLLVNARSTLRVLEYCGRHVVSFHLPIHPSLVDPLNFISNSDIGLINACSVSPCFFVQVWLTKFQTQLTGNAGWNTLLKCLINNLFLRIWSQWDPPDVRHFRRHTTIHYGFCLGPRSCRSSNNFIKKR